MLLGAIYESMAEASDARVYPPPGKLVDMSGYCLLARLEGPDAGMKNEVWKPGWPIYGSSPCEFVRSVMLYFQQLFRASGVTRDNWHTISSVMKDFLNLSDERALALAGQGDQEAFGVLYERYVGRIYNYIYYRTGNQHDAEDLTARVFVRALRHIENYTDRGLPFSAWLYRIAHNLVANWHRDNSRRKEVPLEDLVWIHFNSEHPEAALLQNEEQEGLLLVIRNLPADRQQLLILKFVEHLSNAEIGVIMGRTEGAVKSLYHRTLLSLRDGYLRVKQNGSETSEEYFNGNWMG